MRFILFFCLLFLFEASSITRAISSPLVYRESPGGPIYPLKREEIKQLLFKYFSVPPTDDYIYDGYTTRKGDVPKTFYLSYITKPYQSSNNLCRRMNFTATIINSYDPEPEERLEHRLNFYETAFGTCQENMHWISHFGQYLPDMIIKNMTDSLKKWLNDSSKDQEFKQTYISNSFPKYENLNSISFLDSINLTSWFFCYNFILKTDKDETFQYLDFIQTRESEFKALSYSSSEIETEDMKDPSMALEHRSTRCNLRAYANNE